MELIEELQAKGFGVVPASMGENITTRGIDLLSLPGKTILKIGAEAELEVTGLRNPCAQLDGFQKGLMAAVLARDSEGNLIRKSGVMTVVRTGGTIKPGDGIKVILPDEPHEKLERV